MPTSVVKSVYTHRSHQATKLTCMENLLLGNEKASIISTVTDSSDCLCVTKLLFKVLILYSYPYSQHF